MRKQKILYRILTILLVMILALGSIASAHKIEFLEETIRENLDYMDDIWKYDVPYMNREDSSASEDVQEDEKQTEILKYEKADNIMVALGLFSFDSEGLYNEENTVSYKEYITIMTKLRYGKDAEPENYGIDLEKEEDVTHLAAVKELMDILGYTLSFDDDSTIFRFANAVDLLKKIDYRATKYITRGEFSQLIYNALGIDLMELYSTGARNTYISTEGENLLGVIFGMTEIGGLCTAAAGIDIYSNADIGVDEIAIDGNRFNTDVQDTTGFLGKRVYVLLETGSVKQNVAFIGVEVNDTSVTASFKDLSFSNGKLCYKNNGTEKRFLLSGISNYVYNGVSVSSYSIDSTLLNKEGTITFASTTKNGSYDIAIISVYETFIVDFVSKTPHVRIYFKHNATFDGENFVDLEEKKTQTAVITKNGKSISASEIVPSDIVSVLKSEDDGYIHVAVSSETCNGTINSIKGSNVLKLDDKEYVISESYLELVENGANVVAPAPGKSASLKISAFGCVADIQLTNNVIKYAIIKEFGVAGTPMEPEFQIKLFADTGFWDILLLAEKVTLDGKTKLPAQEAYDALIAESDTICYKPIRYKQNEDGEITFIDTVLNERGERDDHDAIIQSSVWPAVGQMAKTDWTKGTNLNGSTYSISENAVIFKLPNDLEKEDQYIRYRRSQLPAEALSNFVIYNADEFFRGSLIVYTAPTSSSSSYESSLNIMISDIWVADNKDGQSVYKIVGYSSNKTTGANLMEIYTTPEVKQERTDLVPGAVISYMTDADGYANSVGQFITPEQAADPANDRVTFENYNEALGTVLAVDVKGRTVKFRIGEERFDKTNEYSVEEQGGCIFDSETGEVHPLTASDIRPGDRVFIRGLYRKDGIFIYR